LLAAALLIDSVVLSIQAPVALAHGTCNSTSANKFVGFQLLRDDFTGVRTQIEKNNPPLCTQGSTLVPSWSLSWISLEGGNDPFVPGIEIYQGGYAKCPSSSVPASCPSNGGVVYYWIYYAREEGVCGPEFNTNFVDLGDAGSGLHSFKIALASDGTTYDFFIDNVVRYSVSYAAMNYCWGGTGITGAEWQNEMLNKGDSVGGTTADTEYWFDNHWKNANGWHEVNADVGSCTISIRPGVSGFNNEPALWGCYVVNQDGTAYSNIWRVWDKRD
jgi:hypothetical protein